MANLYRRGGRGRWYDQYFDHTGRRKTISARTSERATAQRIADRLEAEAALRRERVIDPREEAIAAQLAKPISDHLFDYRAKMKTAGRGSQHVDETLTILQNLTIACEFARVADINADAINRFAVDLSDSGRSARTVQKHLTAIKSFTKWLTSTGKLLSDPLLTVSKPNPNKDRRLERRMLLHEEWDWLRTVTLS